MAIQLTKAKRIAEFALKYARDNNLSPISVVVLDERGSVKCHLTEDNTPLMRSQIAFSKAFGALALGVNSREIEAMAKERPHFFQGLTETVQNVIPTAGAVLIKNVKDVVVGVVGVSGDGSDNDEKAAIEGIVASGYVAGV